jgi:8-oxo-dGTP pyrophosphatase MutT (NUDIX family)
LRGSHRARILVLRGNQAIGVKGWLGAKDWGLPGGGLQKDELPKVAAARELFEELNIKVNTSNFIDLGVRPYSHRGLKYIYHAFAVQLEESSVIKRRRMELRAAKWLKLDELYQEGEPDVRSTIEAWRALV